MADNKDNLINIRLNVLLLLNAGPKHGYELIKNLGILTGKKVSSGQIYPMLRNLRNRKLVEVVSKGNREKKVYSLTIQGRKAILNALSKMDGLLDFFIKSRTNSCAHCGCEVYRGGCKIKIGSKSVYFCCGNCANSYKMKGGNI